MNNKNHQNNQNNNKIIIINNKINYNIICREGADAKKQLLIMTEE